MVRGETYIQVRDRSAAASQDRPLDRGGGMMWRLKVALIFVVGLAVSYGLALAGEPSSAWLWGLL